MCIRDRYFLDISKGKNKDYNLSECSAESGETVLNALNLALELAKEKKIDAINFGPFNKTSLSWVDVNLMMNYIIWLIN